jgi:DNA-binding transcriptional regulator YdaS (Cro superfamily)
MKLSDITVAQRKRIAALAKTSDGALRHIQAGRRQASADMAIAVERAAKRVGLEIKREDLCAACGGCELARKARRGA